MRQTFYPLLFQNISKFIIFLHFPKFLRFKCKTWIFDEMRNFQLSHFIGYQTETSNLW